MLTSTLTRIVATVGLLAAPLTATAQSVNRGAVHWWLTFPAGAATPEPRSYRLWQVDDHISMSFALSNDSADELTIDTDAIFKAIRVTVQSDTPIAIVTEWENRITRSGNDGTFPLDRSLVLAAHTGFAVSASLRREDGEAFAAQTYAIAVSLRDARTAMRGPTGGTWQGALLPETVINLEIAAPRDPRETAFRYRAQGSQALAKRRYGDALAAFSSALAADPENLEATAGLGHAYLLLNRYRDAITVYERILPRVVTAQHNAIPQMLAFSYVLSNDEPNARRVLGLAGLPAAAIDREMERLRVAARRRRQ